MVREINPITIRTSFLVSALAFVRVGVTAHVEGLGYNRPMLTGSRDGLLQKIEPISIHGQISWDVYYTDADDPEGQVATARVGPESMDGDLKPGDRIRLHFVFSVVTHITPAGVPSDTDS